MSIADIGHGTLVEFLTSGRAFEVKSVRFNGPNRSTFDVTHLCTLNIGGSNNTYKEENVSRVIDPGTVTFVCHFDGRMTTPALDPVESVRVTRPVPSGLTTGHISAFSAVVTSAPTEIEVEGVMMFTLEMKIIGAITETVAA